MVLLESFLMDAECELIRKLYVEFEARFSKELAATDEYWRYKTQGWILTILSFFTVVASTVHTVLTWTVYAAPLTQNLQHWHNLPSCLTLQFRILYLIIAISTFNEFAIVLRINLNEMGERNIQRVFGPYLRGRAFAKGGIIRVAPKTNQPSEEEDERRLRVYKQFYGDIHNLFKSINEHYGWSILAFMIMYFIYFIVNSYWVIFSLIIRLPEHNTLIRNLGFLVIVVVLLWVLCWQSQNSHEQSRHIGCIMFKLVKPLGNKCYNDLVTDFSLQTLHQQYIITAKEFFSLNLNLLGSMVASIVTYLVILIQFMFAGKNRSNQNPLVHSGNSTVSTLH
ncbi:PREDICTED: putative gustatory receptor 23a [Rhagoletis zephyria]|uniref:putative gustatory receptor 23a n=1 Tax=Rhagoletis zephyria TaxID=28612 RepID=UPI0008115637|nr:PREDICTED: putative gustatory receptor 23a [Rhagoletis zephyria]